MRGLISVTSEGSSGGSIGPLGEKVDTARIGNKLIIIEAYFH